MSQNHAFVTVTAAEKDAANAAVLQAFGAVGAPFTIPYFAIAATDDSTPLRYGCGPQFDDAGKAKALQLASAFPDATFDWYDVVSDSSPVAARLAALGLRRSLPLKLP
jgi:hypothetical protein